jgi:hypothetical protein
MKKIQSTKLRATRALRKDRVGFIARTSPFAAYTSPLMSFLVDAKTPYDAIRLCGDALSIQVVSIEPEGKYIDIAVCVGTQATSLSSSAA